MTPQTKSIYLLFFQKKMPDRNYPLTTILTICFESDGLLEEVPEVCIASVVRGDLSNTISSLFH
jgi:hypothetical protein